MAAPIAAAWPTNSSTTTAITPSYYDDVDTVVGLAGGSITAEGSANGGFFVGGSAGHDAIYATAGDNTAFGGGAGDILSTTAFSGTTAAGTPISTVFVGGPGTETLTGAHSSSNNTFFAGSGPETLSGGFGPTAMVAGAGPDFFSPSIGPTLIDFLAGKTAGAADTINSFNYNDFIRLSGYATNVSSVLADATFGSGTETLTLSDGTKVNISTFTPLSASSFIS